MTKKGECFGVDVSGEVTPLIVREAIINCFLEAHKETMDYERKEVGGDESGSTERVEVEGIIRNAFEGVGGDFENPTKEDLEGVVGELKEFAANFRDPKEIEAHAMTILDLIRRISE